MNRLAFCLLLGVLLHSTVLGQESKPVKNESTQVEKELIKLEHEWVDAVKRRDKAWLDKFYSNEFRATSCDGVVTAKADDIRETVDSKNSVESAELEDLHVRVFGNTAVVTGISRTKGQDSRGKPFGPVRFTDVFVKNQGYWQVVATQATRLEKH